jgi:hypothetical protein
LRSKGSAAGSDVRRKLIRTVCPERLPVRRTDTEDGGDKDVLEGGNEEDPPVLETDDIELVGIDLGWNVPSSKKGRED